MHLHPNGRPVSAVPSILFVDGLWAEKFGIMSLIPHLEKDGFDVSLMLTRNTRRLTRQARRTKPDFVAFSVTTGYHLKALEMAAAVKEALPQTTTVFGGPHVTYFPEIVLNPVVNLAFRGECDREFGAGLSLLNEGALPTEVPNLVINDNGQVSMGPLARLVDDLDSLPFADRGHLHRYRFFRHSPYKAFIVSRGCPYNCAFCFNHKLRCLYQGKGRFVRLRSPESIVEEGVHVKSNYGLKLASFEDDLLTFDKEWLEKLLVLWSDRVGVPYNLNATARDLNDPDLVALLKKTGLWCVAFGVETGNETLRTQLLNKPITDENIRKAGELLNRHRVNFMTYNMFALPGETFDDALATIRLNREIGTRLARYTLFQPYPGTQLGDEMAGGATGREMNYQASPRSGTETRRIEKLQKFAMLGMKSVVGERAGIAASYLPASPMHDAVFWGSYFEVVRKYMKTGHRHLAELGVRSLTDWF